MGRRAKSADVDWNGINEQILSRLDIEAVYKGMGVEITGSKPGTNGWLSCRAQGRDDQKASAAINVGSGSTRGRYRDLGGSGDSLSLWDFAARYGHYPSWQLARAEFAKIANIIIPSQKDIKRPIDALEFVHYQLSVIRFWCNKRDPFIRPEIFAETGARLARWPATASDQSKQSVIAFPGYGPAGIESDPVAWLIIDDSGGMIRKYEGPSKPPVMCKDVAVGGSEPCLLNKWALTHLAEAEVVWKVEGISDMLFLQSIIPTELKTKHVVITNGFGAVENPVDWCIRMLTGKHVRLVGDCDKPGQIGVGQWVAALANKAASVVSVPLPYPVVESHGKDLRDFGNDILRSKIPLTAEKP